METRDVEDCYSAIHRDGSRFICSRWHHLQAATRQMLVVGGFYSDRGERLGSAQDGEWADAGFDDLEYRLGVLKQCAASQLPSRGSAEASVPSEALSDEVLVSCDQLLLVREWSDPVFLRLGVAAIAMHQQATALTMVGPMRARSAAKGCIGAMVKLGIAGLMPLALAVGIAAAVVQNLSVATLAFYFFGAGVLACMSAAGVGVPKPGRFEQAYQAWDSLRRIPIGVTGAGALEHLRSMARQGIDVPLVAFDLADTLRTRAGAHSGDR